MLARDIRRVSLCIGPVIVLFYFLYIFHHDASANSAHIISPDAALPSNHDGQEEPPILGLAGEGEPSLQGDATNPFANPDIHQGADETEQEDHHMESEDEAQKLLEEDRRPDTEQVNEQIGETPDEQTAEHLNDNTQSHDEISSLSTSDGKYFTIDFGEARTLNPNIIPHPELNNTWIVVAQKIRSTSALRFTEIACDATFVDGVLRCTKPPIPLPIAPTAGDGCHGDLAYAEMNLGPHDARVFLGPHSPLVVYGSNSRFACFGQFVQDLRSLMDWKDETPGAADFRIGTELQRPDPWGEVEKNWFLFWDLEGQVYVHYDLWPTRGFAKLSLDGSVTPNLAVFAEEQDTACMKKMVPSLASDSESIHQATNSLRVTLCTRDDTNCTPNESNTFILVIYHHKTFYNFQSMYEPYVMLFRSQAPFDIYSMSRLPLWIRGRSRGDEEQGLSGLLYVTSMSWKNKGQYYDGFLNDELFVSFGVEDRESAAIDVRASDLLTNLELCKGL